MEESIVKLVDYAKELGMTAMMVEVADGCNTHEDEDCITVVIKGALPGQI